MPNIQCGVISFFKGFDKTVWNAKFLVLFPNLYQFKFQCIELQMIHKIKKGFDSSSRRRGKQNELSKSIN